MGLPHSPLSRPEADNLLCPLAPPRLTSDLLLDGQVSLQNPGTGHPPRAGRHAGRGSDKD